MDKVLNLMNMINEVDDVTNVAELKNKLEKKQWQMIKARAEKTQTQQQLTSLKQQYSCLIQELQELKDAQLNYQKQLAEKQAIINTLDLNMKNTQEQ